MKMTMKCLTQRFAVHILLLQLLCQSTYGLKLDLASESELDLLAGTAESVIFEIANRKELAGDATAKIAVTKSDKILQKDKAKSGKRADDGASDLLEKLFHTFAAKNQNLGEDYVSVNQLLELAKLKGFTGSLSDFAKVHGLKVGKPVELAKFKKMMPNILPGMTDLIFNQLLMKKQTELTPAGVEVFATLEGYRGDEKSFLAALDATRSGLIPASLLETDGRGLMSRQEFQVLLDSRHPQAMALWPNFHKKGEDHKKMMNTLKMLHEEANGMYRFRK